jgi:replicative DNA helicase Mcm
LPEEYTEEQLISMFEQYLSQDKYITKIQEAADLFPEIRSIMTDFNDLDFYDGELAQFLLAKPNNAFFAAERAIRNLLPPDTMENGISLHFRVKNLPPETSRIVIRDLRAEHMGKFVAVEGLIRKATEVRPKIRDAVFKCLRCGSIVKIHQEDLTFKEPLECSKEQGGCGRAASSTSFKLISEASYFIDTQKLENQEPPEGLRGGSQPERLTIYVDEDLTGKISPGDRVVINGILRTRQRGTKQGGKSTLFDIHLEGNSIELKEKEFEEVEISDEEIQEILDLAKSPDVYDKIIFSIAPSIYGMLIEKLALALQLVSGVHKLMPDDTKIRGDIHILMIGDPGTAKSQLLEYISRLAPRGIYASGKASTAAGLTAAAVRDEFGEGRWVLEAGALVLADGGLACVDEIDKMSPQDRSAMHEAMEQQVIHVAKAGITAALSSRCGVLAAANPKLGRFHNFAPISDQIDMPPALLTRFDVIFPISDKPNRDLDAHMAKHILSAHYGGEIREYRKGSKEKKRFSKKDEEKAMSGIKPILSPEFLRKYVAYARRYVFPVMTKEAMDHLTDFYVNLRARDSEEGEGGGVVAITPRQLEALVRLSEASARLRLSNEATLEDAERAIEIADYYLRKVASEGGVLDIDMLVTGTSHSQRDRIFELLGIIKDLSSGTTSSSVEIDEVLDEADARKMDISKVKADLDKLVRQGTLFKPKVNRIQLA